MWERCFTVYNFIYGFLTQGYLYIFAYINVLRTVACDMEFLEF